MLVRNMQTDVVPMREVKLKCFVFGEISCLWWGILLFYVSLLFSASLNSVLLVGYRDGVYGCTHSVGERDVVPMREVKLKFSAFGGISCLWWGILCVFGGK